MEWESLGTRLALHYVDHYEYGDSDNVCFVVCVSSLQAYYKNVLERGYRCSCL